MIKEDLIIRKYSDKDKIKVLDLLRTNTPKYFAPEEEKDLIYYLDNEIEEYYVLVFNNEIIGCGGINYKENHTIGYISWDFFHPNYQRQGYGSMILNYRINKLKGDNNIKQIIVRTTQLVYRFYEKNGFRLIEQAKDYWAKGYDLYKMEYKL